MKTANAAARMGGRRGAARHLGHRHLRQRAYGPLPRARARLACIRVCAGIGKPDRPPDEYRSWLKARPGPGRCRPGAGCTGPGTKVRAPTARRPPWPRPVVARGSAWMIVPGHDPVRTGIPQPPVHRRTRRRGAFAPTRSGQDHQGQTGDREDHRKAHNVHRCRHDRPPDRVDQRPSTGKVHRQGACETRTKPVFAAS